ncbi:MAG TPA: hypothetical protein PKD85_00520 [Saprospiraceae bacterium]|nr:hypothetical protein [Saprospiraceae bacterium]
MSDLQNQAKFMHDQLEESYQDGLEKERDIFESDKRQKYIIILASIILTLIVILA